MIQNVLFEFDNDKRVQIVQEFQRYMAKLFYYSRYPGRCDVIDTVVAGGPELEYLPRPRPQRLLELRVHRPFEATSGVGRGPRDIE
jgi:hypothetical protein